MGYRPGRQHVSPLPVRLTIRFASAILLRPFQVNKNKKDATGQPEVAKSDYERQVELKTRLKSMLENEQLIPRVRRT